MPDKSKKRPRAQSSQSRYKKGGNSARTRKRTNPIDQNDPGVSLQEARRNLQRMIIRTHDRRAFIPLGSIKEFWDDRLQDFLEGLGCSVDQNRADRIQTSCVRIFTALVLAEWEDDEHFRRKFEKVFRDDASPVWTNGFLEYVNFLTSDDSGLSEDEEGSLQSAVDLVAVPVLEPNKGSIKLPRGTTLPITHRDEIGRGTYGKVYEIKIAEGCFMVENTTSGILRPNEVCHGELNECALLTFSLG
ncbi:MAG: hypothetical protein Q9171_007411 [Xanthocarpia ochracea]